MRTTLVEGEQKKYVPVLPTETSPASIPEVGAPTRWTAAQAKKIAVMHASKRDETKQYSIKAAD
jgi:hypothetical protein